MSEVVKPQPHYLDYLTSIAYGWDPESNDEPKFSFGHLSKDFMEFSDYWKKLFQKLPSIGYGHLLDPINAVAEPETMPIVANPSSEDLVVIDPDSVLETGLIPLASYWQSGYGSALPYVFVRQGVYERLLKASELLRQIDPDLGLSIADGWRPLSLQGQLYKIFYPNGHTPGEPLYVSPPNKDDAHAAPHPSGGAADVLITYKSIPLRVGADFDYMDLEANIDHFENTDDMLTRDTRRFLANVMSAADFCCIDSEWWHFEYGTRRWAAKTGGEPIYGNIHAELTDAYDISPVKPIPGSKRESLINRSLGTRELS